jgi:hypothetical protein
MTRGPDRERAARKRARDEARTALMHARAHLVTTARPGDADDAEAVALCDELLDRALGTE